MYRKWLGWKKVAVCLVGAAMIMQGASIAMASDEYPMEQETTASDENAQESTDTDSEEKNTDEEETKADEEKSSEEKDSEEQDTAEDSESEAGSEDVEKDAEETDVTENTIDPEETPEESDEVLEAEENGTDAEEAGLLVTGTVSHIDMSRVASASLTVGDKTLTQTVVFDEGDLGNITVSPDYVGAIVMGQGQIHIAGVFPTGTYACPIEYTVSITKDVTFTDSETGKTYTQTMTFTSSFNYWDESNMCPSLGWREYWSHGFVIPWSGMDFGFGTASAVIPAPTEPAVTPGPGETDPTVTPTATPGPGETDPTGTPTVTPGPGETDPTETPDPSETPETPDPTEDPDATETPAPTVTDAGNNGGTGTNGTGSDNNASGNQKSDGVKTADETNVAGSALMFLFAFVDVVLAFWALRLKHRRNK